MNFILEPLVWILRAIALASYVVGGGEIAVRLGWIAQHPIGSRIDAPVFVLILGVIAIIGAEGLALLARICRHLVGDAKPALEMPEGPSTEALQKKR
jgi:hypothetical protein